MYMNVHDNYVLKTIIINRISVFSSRSQIFNRIYRNKTHYFTLPYHCLRYTLQRLYPIFVFDLAPLFSVKNKLHTHPPLTLYFALRNIST